MPLPKIKSINHKLILWFAIIIASTLLVFFIVFIRYNARSTEVELNNQADHVLSFSMKSLARAMWQYNHEYVKDYVDSLFLYKDIVFVQAIAGNQIVQTKARDRYKDIDFIESTDLEKFIVRKSNIVYENATVGRIVFIISKNRVKQQVLRSSLAASSLLLFIVTIISLSMYYLSRKYILNPLTNLEDSARHIANGNIDASIDTASDDEIGHLAKTFSLMMQKIKAITASRDELNDEILERKRAEKALVQFESRNRLLVNTIPDLVWLKDQDGVYLSCNTMFERFFGAKESEIVGRTDYDFIDKDLADFFRANDRRAMASEQPSINEEELVFADNGYCGLFETIKMPLQDSDGNLIGVLGIARDISERERVAIEKLQLERKLKHSQKMESIGNLAGGIAHDFNNVLASIIGFTELALDETSKGTTLEDSLQEVYSAGIRAKELVKQILAFARKSEEKQSPIQPSLVAKEVLQFIRSTIPTTIEIKQDIRSDAVIMANTTQLHQVLMNLCTNAAHAMEEGGGVLEVVLNDQKIDRHDLSIGMAPGDYIKFEVSDTGVGIPAETIGSIFEPYFTTKAPGEGTGMGLAMVHGIVESYGGKIDVQSRLGKGTAFSIYLPVTRKRSALGEYLPEQLPTGTEHILFVDDEAPIAKMGSQILGRLGYRVTTLTSSVEALELFRSKPGDFDLVISDMTMPNMTGDELAMELIAFRSNIPVILCTGYSKKISDESVTDIGIKAFAYKPIVKADLAKTVRKVLDEAKT